MVRALKHCRESAEIMAVWKCRAVFMAMAVFPDAVGPTMIITFRWFIGLFIITGSLYDFFSKFSSPRILAFISFLFPFFPESFLSHIIAVEVIFFFHFHELITH